MALMLCWIVSGIGILLLKEWARQLLLISMGIYFLNKAVDIFINAAVAKEIYAKIPVAGFCVGIIFVLVFSMSITYFFTHPSVEKQFKIALKHAR